MGGRYALTKSSGKARKKKGRKQLKQLNAALPEQLVLDFNDAAKEHGRDELLTGVILSYLEKASPGSKSVRKHKEKQNAAAISNLVAKRKAATLSREVSERDALRLSRHFAEKIIEVTRDYGRKDPKRAPKRDDAIRKRRA